MDREMWRIEEKVGMNMSTSTGLEFEAFEEEDQPSKILKLGNYY